MLRLLLIYSLIVVVSCNNKNLEVYKKIVDSSDSVVIFYKNKNSISIQKIQLQNIKSILKRNVEPESPRKFRTDDYIILYKNGSAIGVFLVSKEADKRYVNFRSNNINFTFPLTYGMGMTLDNYSSSDND